MSEMQMQMNPQKATRKLVTTKLLNINIKHENIEKAQNVALLPGSLFPLSFAKQFAKGQEIQGNTK